jgi:hypothetical protein
MISSLQSQPLIIFLHLPKTAGSTLARIIERQYTASSILPLYGSSLGEELAAIPQQGMDRLRILTGHLYFGVHSFSSRPSTYITVLRDPVDRVISHYYFVRRDPSNYLYDSARKMSLREFVESSNQQEPNNDQTRLLAGKCDTSSFGICTDDMLNMAKRNLAEYFAVVGITEEFDRSLILMKRILGWRTPFYTKQNVSQHRLRKGDIPLETLRVIQDYNKLDIDLYRYAKELFDKQIRSQSRSFEGELQRFKKLNGAYSRLHPLVSVAWEATAKIPVAGHLFMRDE